MPFTPYHSEVGILTKSIMMGRFSLVVFLWSQFLYDLEVLINIQLGSNRLHTWSHTIIGMFGIALITVATAKPMYRVLAKLIQDLWKLPECPTWKVIIYSSFIGVTTHLPLDAIMHYDVRIFHPFSNTNSLYELISVVALHNMLLFYSCGWNHLVCKKK